MCVGLCVCGYVWAVEHYPCSALLIYLIGINRSEELKTAQLTASNLSRTHYCLFYRIPFSWMRILKTVQRSACIPLIARNLEVSEHNGDGWCVHRKIFQKSNDEVQVLGEVFKLYYANKLVVFCVIFLLFRLNFTRIVCMDHKFSTVFFPYIWDFMAIATFIFVSCHSLECSQAEVMMVNSVLVSLFVLFFFWFYLRIRIIFLFRLQFTTHAIFLGLENWFWMNLSIHFYQRNNIKSLLATLWIQFRMFFYRCIQ